MASSSTPIEIVLRMEPEELRERRGTLRLKACPFCGGAVEPRWAPCFSNRFQFLCLSLCIRGITT